MPVPSDQPIADDLRELILRAQEGDLDSAYAVLAEQVSVDTWERVISALERKAGEVDLELVAHRTLRRKPAAVPRAILALVRAAGTPQAAFIAVAIAKLRSEEWLVEEASEVGEQLARTNDPIELLADGQSLDALYATLALPLAEAKDLFVEIGTADQGRAELLDALRAEYERLQELAKDRRWRAGSYRHVLRHALADLALIAEVGGKLEDQAFRLLQQRTDDPGSNRELLRLLPDETRRAYLTWVVRRPPGKEETGRALFTLEEIECRYPDDVPRSAIANLLASKNDAIAIAASAAVVRMDPDDRSNDRPIADLISRLEPRLQAEVIDRIAMDAPSRLRPDLWPSETDDVLAASDVDAVTETLTRLFQAAADSELRRRMLTILLRRQPEESIVARVARSVLKRATEPEVPEVAALLQDSAVTGGVWLALRGLPFVPERLLTRLIDVDGPTKAAARLAEYSDDVTAAQPTVRRLVLEHVEAGSLAIALLGKAATSVELIEPALARVKELNGRLAELQELVSHGDQAAEVELSRALAPLVARAMDRSVGNERLASAYQRLSPGMPNGAGEPLHDGSALETDLDELDALGSALHSAGLRHAVVGDEIRVTVDGNGDEVAQIRALAVIDQHLERVPGRARATVVQMRTAVAVALARSGLAQRAMHDLAVRGRLAPAATALSAASRNELFDAASAEGLSPPDEWLTNPLIAQWVKASSPALESEVSATAETALTALQRLGAAVRDTELRLADARLSARRSFFAATEPAFSDLDDAEDAYTQLWLGLSRLGIERVAAPGSVIGAEEVDADRVEIVGDARGSRYVVRFGGVIVGEDVLRRARVEAVT